MQEVNRDDLVREATGLPELTAPDSDDKEIDNSEQANSVEDDLTALAVAKANL